MSDYLINNWVLQVIIFATKNKKILKADIYSISNELRKLIVRKSIKACG